jgi:hypothetical protein
LTVRCATAITPALVTIASSGARLATACTHARTDAGSDRSHATASTGAPTERAASVAAASVRAAPTTVAPRLASTRIVSWPSPDATPVTRIRFPERSSPSVTCSAVLSYPNPVGPLALNHPTTDMSAPSGRAGYPVSADGRPRPPPRRPNLGR